MEHETKNKILNQLGLSKNEADVYQALLELGEAGVGEISKTAKVHRRNVYDVLNRLLEKGFVFIVLSKKENRYQAVNPNKLSEFIDEQKNALNSIMPDLQKIQQEKTKTEEIMIYRGPAGWKRYIRDVIRIGQDVYTIGAKAAWTDERLKNTVELYNRESADKKIKMHILYCHGTDLEKIKQFNPHEFRFLPANYSTDSSVDIFGDYTVIVSNAKMGKISDDALFTVIINPQISDAFKVWFKLMWKLCAGKNYDC
ncbi:MAG: helix-turn-helix domain-containing protein [Patescibacteria group bacterium]